MSDAYHYVVKATFNDLRIGARLTAAEGDAALKEGRAHQIIRVAGPVPGTAPDAPAEK